MSDIAAVAVAVAAFVISILSYRRTAEANVFVRRSAEAAESSAQHALRSANAAESTAAIEIERRQDEVEEQMRIQSASRSAHLVLNLSDRFLYLANLGAVDAHSVSIEASSGGATPVVDLERFNPFELKVLEHRSWLIARTMGAASVSEFRLTWTDDNGTFTKAVQVQMI